MADTCDSQFRRLGKSGVLVSALGFGCMGLSEFRSPAGDADSRRAIRLALDRGITHFDTADFYGDGGNEALVGSELRGVRPRVVLASKCGIVRHASGTSLDGTPGYLRRACEASLRRLGTDYLDLLYLHRVDPRVAIEDSVGAMARLVAEGKVRWLGLSKIDSATLRRAESIHPLAAVQMNYSLWHRGIEDDLLGTCMSDDVALVAYSPLGKGLGTSRIMREPAFDDGDERRRDPAFDGSGLARSRSLLEVLSRYAAAEGCTVPQLAIAWVLSRGPQVIPIPGMRTTAHVQENVAALAVRLSPATLQALESAARFDGRAVAHA